MNTSDAKPGGGHTMRVTLNDDTVILMPVCHEPEGADCRVACSEGCESFSYPDHEHKLDPVDWCNAVEYMNLAAEEYRSDNSKDDGEIALFDGMPIEVEWNGDCYVWAPVKPPAVTP